MLLNARALSSLRHAQCRRPQHQKGPKEANMLDTLDRIRVHIRNAEFRALCWILHHLMTRAEKLVREG
jgi:hypothetical protein